MIATLVLALAAVPALQNAAPAPPVPDSSPNAGQIVSDMIARYHGATTMTGTITYRVRALGAEQPAVQTEFQFESPSRLYIRQTPATSRVKPVNVVSDGTTFLYTVPVGDGLIGEGEPLREAVNRDGVLLTVRDMYAAASRSLIDRNTPLDLAFGRMEDLQFARRQWASLRLLAPVTVDGRELYRVGGEWRAYGEAEIEGSFEMLITRESDLVRFSVTRTVATTPGSPAETLTDVWDVAIQVNGTPDPARFKVN